VARKKEGPALTQEELFEKLCKESKSQKASDILDRQNNMRCYPTGCTPLDIAFGCIDPVTGLPGIRQRGKVEVFGPYSSLKTVLLENLTINVLNDDPDNRVVFVLPEEGDIARLASRGADLDRIHVLAYYDADVEAHWRNGENVLARAAEFAKIPQVKLVGIDSWAQLTLQTDIEDKDGEQIDYGKAGKVGSHASLCQRFLKDWNTNNHSAILFGTNQIRDFIPTSKFNMFEDKTRTKTPGGNALRHNMDWRVECYSKKHEADKDHPFLKKALGEGLDFHFRMIKQKSPRKYGDKVGQNTFWFDPPGFDMAEGILPFAEFFGIIQRSGTAHYIVNDQKFHGKDNLIHYLDSNPEYMDLLLKQVVELNKNEEYYSGVARPSAKL
jgi:RecA/RadA recombinase